LDNLRKMLEQKGLQLLDLASPKYLPGHLIKVHYSWKFGDFRPQMRLDEDRGLATKLLEIDPLALTPRIPSDIVITNVTDQFDIAAGVGLPQFGLTAGASMRHGTTVTWNISAIETVAFSSEDVQTYFNSILPQLRQKSSPPWVRECFFLKQVFFAQTISGTVHTAGNLDGKAAFGEAGINASGSLSLNWTADHTTFVIQGTNQVPFAARGDALG
jgi:hypothetical protein